jgi:lipopolysaccharide/colanic/teichoic acid biosynthesis glycosyltransferase
MHRIPAIRQDTLGTLSNPLNLLQRQRVHLAGGILAAVLLPWLARHDLSVLEHLSRHSQVNSLAGVSIAVLIGYYLFRQLTRHPGIITAAYILPTFLFSYALVLAVFFFLRIDYSRLFFAVSFAGAQIWFHAAHMVASRALRLSFDVLPFGNARKVLEVPGVDWRIVRVDRPRFESAHGIVADLRINYDEQWESLIAAAAISGVPVYHYKQIKERLTGRVDIEHLSENNFGSLVPDLVYLRFKRLFDIALALLALPLFLAVMAIVALVILVRDGRPVFFIQERTGYRGRTFRLWKFRTMRTQTETGRSALEASVTRERDPRITPTGRFLRKTRLDEIPQIFNVLRGDMSWIGPRPEAVPLSRLYESRLPFYRYRHIVRPGITGWAQVNQGHVADVDEVLDKLHYDFYYIKNFSIWLDMLIALRTVTTVLTGHGAR